jgi:hypothetical protein
LSNKNTKNTKIMKITREAIADMSKPNTSRAGVKILIAVASVGCTVGGWMAFSANAPAAGTTTAQPAQSSTPYALQPAVLPTLVPIDDAIAASNAAAAQPQARAPQTQVMRSVTLLQQPVAMSRSSR